MRVPRGEHVHGYSLSTECDDELCRAHWRGYMKGRRSRVQGRRNAAVIEAVKLLRPDEEDGPVRVRKVE